jgi:O-antigen/teichoic acid export membrane protein
VSSPATSDERFALSRKTTGNALFGFGAFAYAAVLSVVITPLLVHGLGATYYGIFVLSAAALGFVGVLDLGMGTALVRFLSSSVGRGDIVEARSLIQASIAFYAIVGAVGFGVMVLLGLVFAPALFDLTGNQLSVARFALIVSGGAFQFDTVARAFSVVPVALQRSGVSAAFRIVFGTLGAGTSAAIVTAGLGLRWLVGAYALIDVAGLAVSMGIARRVIPGLRLAPRWDRARIRRLMTFSGWIFLANISAFVIFQFDRLMLGALATVSAVTYYAVPSSMASYLLAATTSLASIVIPATGDLIARGESLRVDRLYRRSTRLCVLFVGSAGIPAVFFADPLLTVWLGHQFAARSTAILQILVVTFILFSLTVIPYNMLVAGGFPRIVGVLNLVIAVLNVILIFVLIPPYGAKGAAIAYLLSIAVFPLFIWFAERRVLGFARIQWFSIVWRVLPPLAVQAGVCALLQPVVGADAGLAPVLLLMLPLPALVYFFTGLIDADERQIVRHFLGRRRTASP